MMASQISLFRKRKPTKEKANHRLHTDSKKQSKERAALNHAIPANQIQPNANTAAVTLHVIRI